MIIKPIASGSSGNCYYIGDGETSLLLDAGIPFKEIQRGVKFQIASINACLVTHRHADHAKSVCELQKHGVPIYAPDDVFTSETRIQGLYTGCEAYSEYSVGSLAVYPFNVKHDVPNLGYLIYSRRTHERLVYFTDCLYVETRFPKLDYIIGEANYEIGKVNNGIGNGSLTNDFKARVVQTHMSIDTFIGFLKANDLSNLKQIYLCHLSDKNSDAEKFKRAVTEIAGCECIIC